MSPLKLGLLAIALFGLLIGKAALAQAAEVSDRSLTEVVELYRQEGPAAAVPEFERLLQKFRASGDRKNEAIVLGQIGDCHRRLGNFEQARDRLDQALALSRDLGDQLQEGKTLNVYGLLYWEMGNYDQALERFGQGSDIARQLDHQKLEGVILNNISLVYDELGDYPRSLVQYQEVLQLYRDAEFPRGESDTLGNLGGVYLLLGRYREALGYYQRALNISQGLGLKPSMSQDLGNLALCYLGLGQIDPALESFDRALGLASAAGLKQDEAFWLNGKGNALIKNGRYDLGLEHHRRALDIYAEVGAKAELLEALHDMGQLHLLLGDPVSSADYFRRAIELARSIGLARGITTNLLALGDLQRRRQLYKEAEELYGQALQRASESEEQGHLAESLLRLARIHRNQQQFGEAADEVQQALDIARDTGARSLEAEALYALAETDRLRGVLPAALLGFAAAERVSTQMGDPDLLWQIKYGQAQALAQSGKKDAAVAILKETISLIEGVRDRLREERFRTGYVQDKAQVYIDLVRLQLELGRIDDAFAAAERLRARNYLALVVRGGPVPPNAEEGQLETELRARIRQLRRALSDEEGQRAPERRQRAIEVFSGELIVAEQEYQAFLDDHRGTRAAPASLDVIPTHAEIGQRLAQDEALIEYVVSEDRVTVFVLRAQTLFATASPLRLANLRSKVELLRDLIRRPGSDRWQKPAASLSRTLIEPIEQAGWLKGVKHLYLVPHGNLNYLPYAVLLRSGPSGPRLMIEDYTLSYLPSAALLMHEPARADSATSLLAVAPERSRLRHTSEEVRALDALFRPQAHILIGQSATESSFKDLSDGYRVLHLATHGYFNKLNPLLSGLELEPDEFNDGLLEVHEILELRLNADLVTLSACQTGLGSGYFAEMPAGDDFVGLTRAFLHAGSATVLATLWQVDDLSTMKLMGSFYRRVRQGSTNGDKAVALARAQRELRASALYGHPYFWAPFVLIGAMSQGIQKELKVQS